MENENLFNLNKRQRLFCKAYASGKTQTEAAEEAGYGPNYGKELAQREDIQRGIEQAKKQVHKNDAVSDRVIQMYEKMAFSDIRDFVTFGTIEKDGKKECYLELKKDSEVDGQLIEQITIASNGVPRIKLYDKQKALEKLEKYYDLLPDEWKRSIEEKKLAMADKDKGETFLKVYSSIPRPEQEDEDANL